MAEPDVLRVSLKYEGPDVNDGSMSIADIVPALQGFGSAYEKIAALENLSHEHRLRVAGLTKSSAEIHIRILEWMAANSTALTMVGGAASFIVTSIITVIKLKKHTASKPYDITTQSSTDSRIAIHNHLKVSFEVSPKDYEVFKSGLVDDDLNKMIRPLNEKRVDDMMLAIPENDQFAIVNASEKDYFNVPRETITTTKEIWVEGFLDSLTKSRNRGTFYLKGGRSVPYKLAAENPTDLYLEFAYNGPVRVRCLAHLDQNLEPSLLEIYEIQRLQRQLFN